MSMVTKTGGIAVAALALLVVPGCGRRGPDAEVIATVGGRALTKADVRDTVLVTARIAELAGRPVPKERFARWGNAKAARIAPGLVQARLLDLALEDAGVAPTAESNAKMLAKYGRLTRRKAADLDALAPQFGELETVFRAQFARESRFEAFYAVGQSLAATEGDFEAFYAARSNLLTRCRRISEAGWRKARRAHAKLVAGEPWETVAKDFSDDADIEPTNADNWREWLTVSADKIEPSALAAAVAKLSPGGFTEPIDIDEGLVIVRLNGREGTLCDLARILVRMGRDIEIPDRESAEREIVRDKRLARQREFLDEARAKYAITYPNGTNVTFALWQEAPSPGKVNLGHKK